MLSLYPFYLIGMGLIPSLIWLSFFLKKDSHPEPKYLITETFLLGMVTAPFVIGFQFIFPIIFANGNLDVISHSPSFFMWAAFFEELFKFLVVWIFIIRRVEFDEPVDAMIYMITAGLGFAAIENMLFLFKTFPEGVKATLSVWGLRFVGATFLHALAAGITGYFLAVAWFFRQHFYLLIISGLIISSLFHFTFNILILRAEGNYFSFYYALFLLLLFSSLISVLFNKIKTRATGKLST